MEDDSTRSRNKSMWNTDTTHFFYGVNNTILILFFKQKAIRLYIKLTPTLPIRIELFLRYLYFSEY